MKKLFYILSLICSFQLNATIKNLPVPASEEPRQIDLSVNDTITLSPLEEHEMPLYVAEVVTPNSTQNFYHYFTAEAIIKWARVSGEQPTNPNNNLPITDINFYRLGSLEEEFQRIEHISYKIDESEANSITEAQRTEYQQEIISKVNQNLTLLREMQNLNGICYDFLQGINTVLTSVPIESKEILLELEVFRSQAIHDRILINQNILSSEEELSRLQQHNIDYLTLRRVNNTLLIHKISLGVKRENLMLTQNVYSRMFAGLRNQAR